MDDATFSGLMSQFLALDAIQTAFGGNILRREVNILKHDNFPLLAAWVESGAEAGGTGSDGEYSDETTYTIVVADRLADGDAQDVVIGRLVKAVKDAAETFGVAGQELELEIGYWSSDNNAADGAGDKVWASFPITLTYTRDQGSY